MDAFYEDEKQGRAEILNGLNYLNTIQTENPNSMFMQFFFQGKSNELVKIFSKANSDIRTRARELLIKLDISNAAAYKSLCCVALFSSWFFSVLHATTNKFPIIFFHLKIWNWYLVI
jgi:hypothetical protein